MFKIKVVLDKPRTYYRLNIDSIRFVEKINAKHGFSKNIGDCPICTQFNMTYFPHFSHNSVFTTTRILECLAEKKQQKNNGIIS